MTTTTEESAPPEGWHVISSYSRAQALEDGVLVDLMQGDLVQLAAEAGIKVPMVCTAAVWAECFDVAEVTGLDERPEWSGQSLTGRAWDCFNMFRMAARRIKASHLMFQFYCLRASRPGGQGVDGETVPKGTDAAVLVTLQAVIEPDDTTGAPVITLMMEDES